MSKFEEKIEDWNQKTRQIRQKYFQVLIKILVKSRINANQLSSLKIILAIIYLFIVNHSFKVALACLVLAVIIDIFDGPLARYQHQESDRGKFIDMFSDYLVYVLFIFGLIMVNIGNSIYLAYNLVIIPVIYLLIILNKNENKKSDWIIKPVAQATFYKIIIELIVALYVFNLIKIDVFNIVLLLTNFIISLHAIYHFLIFLKKHQKYLNDHY